jgi:hypothetical protein
MAKTIEEIRKQLALQDEKKNFTTNGKNQGGDKTVFPFWDMDFDQSSTVRFLPDGNESNDFFWQERLVIKLPFQGIKGQNDKLTTVTVPCIEMFGKKCPIMEEIRPWWKDDSLISTARTYYKKKSYLFQGFVVKSGLNEEGEKVGRYDMRRFVINSSIYDLIKQSIMDPDMDQLPTDYEAGRDFKIAKTKKGDWANYGTSGWSMKARPLDEEELTMIETNGLWNLKDFLPKEPNDTELQVIKQMFEASLDGEAYDPDRWGDFYKPSGLIGNNNSSSTTAAAADEDDVVVTKTVVAPAATVSTENRLSALDKLRASHSNSSETAAEAKVETVKAKDPKDILANIRARAAANNS